MLDRDPHGKPGLPQFFLDANVRFPLRPVIAEGLSVRVVPRGLGIDFQGGPRRFVIRGGDSSDIITFLRATLDGRNTLPDILERVPPGLDPVAVLDVLKLMHQRGVLIDARHVTEDAPAPKDPNVQFWQRKLGVTRSAESATVLMSRVTGSAIAMVVSGMIGELAIEFLLRLGCASIRFIPLSSIDGAGAQAVCSYGRVSNTPEGREVFLSTLREEVRAADLLVVAMHGSSRTMTGAINDIVIETRTPLLYADDNGEIGTVMFVEPRRSACLRCRELREELTSEFALEDYLLSVEDEKSGSWHPDFSPAGETFPGAALIAAHISGEATRYLTSGSTLMLTNSVLHIDLVSGSSRVHPVLRVPRCPACSSTALFAVMDGRPQ